MIKDSWLLHIEVLVSAPKAPFAIHQYAEMVFIMPLGHSRHDITRIASTLILRPDFNIVNLSIIRPCLLPGLFIDVIAIMAEFVRFGAGDVFPLDDDFEKVLLVLDEISAWMKVLLYASGSDEVRAVNGGGAAEEESEERYEAGRSHG
mmetsp:Transcript_39832/g.83737  ORF Transcript_39832/g.83737 Transcript_39832/m.83737 type:complete len:148 (-) Transcript_39832:146-589(-)|eukprot:CAMPEP_0183725376 /NCGR_PEP_ID=MMETSP0737-20130205/20368_1 /TAXON_ID=385413 /ORGANISM="Thalassiosira miniscula, Strain CCMP1093" /LENGTH=147 /DNA_ID=CAMNT_0025956337 /DNA_START=56 /DNA_END=499 /DNA_ORIENTATION=+